MNDKLQKIRIRPSSRRAFLPQQMDKILEYISDLEDRIETLERRDKSRMARPQYDPSIG
jgi:hypothetical protein